VGIPLLGNSRHEALLIEVHPGDEVLGHRDILPSHDED
jgi:hypothetical protein